VHDVDQVAQIAAEPDRASRPRACRRRERLETRFKPRPVDRARSRRSPPIAWCRWPAARRRNWAIRTNCGLAMRVQRERSNSNPAAAWPWLPHARQAWRSPRRRS
jgi:hypothetical protein